MNRRKFIRRGLLFVPATGLLIQRAMPAVLIRKISSAGSGTSISDDFSTTPFTTRFNYLTTGNFTWNAGGYVTSVANSAIYATTACTGQNQYVKFKLNTAQYAGAVFRATTAGSAGFYVLELYQDVFYFTRWNNSGWITDIQELDYIEFAANDTIGATIVGTGASTVVRAWINPTGNAPDAGGTTWNSAAADTTSSSDPGTYYTGSHVGIGTQLNAKSFDDFYGGDIS